MIQGSKEYEGYVIPAQVRNDPIILRGSEDEYLWVSINSDLTVAGAGTTLSAKARAYKVVG